MKPLKAIRELLPKVAICAVLITSRFSGNLSGVRSQELALFETEESREYLRTHLHPGLRAKVDCTKGRTRNDSNLARLLGARLHLRTVQFLEGKRFQ
jgi:hypothetical protein